MMYHYNLIKINSLTTTSLFVKSFIHTTSVLSSSSTDSALRTRLGNLNEQLKLKQLESIKYEDDVSSTSISDLSITSYADSFPCLLDSAGKAIDVERESRGVGGWNCRCCSGWEGRQARHDRREARGKEWTVVRGDTKAGSWSSDRAGVTGKKGRGKRNVAQPFRCHEKRQVM